jgi:hypothetical protein
MELINNENTCYSVKMNYIFVKIENIPNFLENSYFYKNLIENLDEDNEILSFDEKFYPTEEIIKTIEKCDFMNDVKILKNIIQILNYWGVTYITYNIFLVFLKIKN